MLLMGDGMPSGDVGLVVEILLPLHSPLQRPCALLALHHVYYPRGQWHLDGCPSSEPPNTRDLYSSFMLADVLTYSLPSSGSNKFLGCKTAATSLLEPRKTHCEGY